MNNKYLYTLEGMDNNELGFKFKMPSFKISTPKLALPKIGGKSIGGKNFFKATTPKVNIPKIGGKNFFKGIEKPITAPIDAIKNFSKNFKMPSSSKNSTGQEVIEEILNQSTSEQNYYDEPLINENESYENYANMNNTPDQIYTRDEIMALGFLKLPKAKIKFPKIKGFPKIGGKNFFKMNLSKDQKIGAAILGTAIGSQVLSGGSVAIPAGIAGAGSILAHPTFQTGLGIVTAGNQILQAGQTGNVSSGIAAAGNLLNTAGVDTSLLSQGENIYNAVKNDYNTISSMFPTVEKPKTNFFDFLNPSSVITPSEKLKSSSDIPQSQIPNMEKPIKNKNNNLLITVGAIGILGFLMLKGKN